MLDIFVDRVMQIKELAKENEEFKVEYLATRKSILTTSIIIIALSALVITLIYLYG